MANSEFIERFKVDSAILDKDELVVFEKLLEAAELMSNVYALQLTKGKANFYPPDATKSEIEKAASSDPAIFSPYTVVERNSNGKLTALPYHVKYAPQLRLVSKKLEEAARICKNSEFAHALNVQAKSLLDGNYDKAQITWMRVKPYIIDVVIGPLERYDDQLFYIKRSYQAWVGIMHRNLTARAVAFKDAVFGARRRLYPPTEKVDFMEKAQIRVDNTAIFAGLVAKYRFSATTLPNDVEIMEKHGTEATVFLPVVRDEFDKIHMPLFKAIFSPEFRQAFSEDDLERGYIYTVIMHEIARVLIRYRFATNRLQEFYPVFNEIAVEAAGIKNCGNLLLKDMISQKEMEAVLVMFITRMFDYYQDMKDKPAMKPYVLGNAILLNSLLSSGGLQVTKNGISWPNFTKMFIAVSDLADEMEKILAEGSYKDAQHYLSKHSSLSVFKQFSYALKALH